MEGVKSTRAFKSTMGGWLSCNGISINASRRIFYSCNPWRCSCPFFFPNNSFFSPLQHVIEGRFYRNLTFTRVLSKLNFHYWNSITKFSLLKTLLSKLVFFVNYTKLYLGSIFWGLGQLHVPPFFTFFLGGT